MKANTPALYLYFTTCFLCIFFYVIGMEWLVAYVKAMVIPSVCYYYFASNKHKIDWIKAFIFLLCFIGDVFILIDYEHSFLGSLICFFSVYMLLLCYFIKDFNIKKFRRICSFNVDLLFALGYILPAL